MKLLSVLFCGAVAVSSFSGLGVTYRHSENGSPRTLDTINANTTYANSIITAVYDTLYEYKYLKIPYELKPSLAATMPKVSKDGMTFTIDLKKGVRFIDDPCFKNGVGREVIAEDFVYSIKRHFDPKSMSSGKWVWQDRILGLDEWGRSGANYKKLVPGLRSVGKYRIRITLSKPYPQFLYTLAMGFSAVVPYEAVQKYGKQLSIHPVGSGPWILTEINGKQARLKKNPKYRREVFKIREHGYDRAIHGASGVAALDGRRLPIVDEVLISFVKHESARWNSFTKGNEIQYDTVPSIQLNNVLHSKSPISLNRDFKKKYHMSVSRELGYVYTEFNMNHPDIGYHPDPKQNKRNWALRCAIRKGFDWKHRIKSLYHGIGEAFPGIIPPGVEGYDPTLSKGSVTLDVKGAKALLAKYGWNKKNLPILEYSSVASVKDKQIFAQFRTWMSRIGFPKHKIKLKSFATFGDYSRAIKNGNLMLHSMAWALDYPDAENTLQLYYGPNKSPGSNSANYNNSSYDRIYEKSIVMGPSNNRRQMYREANQKLIDDCVVISGFSRTRIHLWHKNVVMFPNENILGNYFKYIAVH